MPIKARAKLACEIAGIDPQRFNEMVHAGHYPCAPATRPGSARIFEIDEIVALRIFGNFLKMGMVPERAGKIACQAFGQFVDDPDVSHMVYMIRRNGAMHMVKRIKTDDDSLPEHSIVMDIPSMREFVVSQLEYERDNQIVGEG